MSDAPANVHHAALDEFKKALSGLDYPASKAAIINKARDKGGLDAEVSFVLEHIHDHAYGSFDEIAAEIRQAYERAGGLADAGPAARPAASRDDRRTIEKKAGPRGDAEG
jgi:hypothetical protein